MCVLLYGGICNNSAMNTTMVLKWQQTRCPSAVPFNNTTASIQTRNTVKCEISPDVLGTAVTINDMKDCYRVKLELQPFFTQAINGAEWSVSRIGHFVSGEEFQYPVRNRVLQYRYTKINKKMQLCGIIYYSLAALHVSSDIFAHYQEHLNCITASGITNVCRCRLVS